MDKTAAFATVILFLVVYSALKEIGVIPRKGTNVVLLCAIVATIAIMIVPLQSGSAVMEQSVYTTAVTERATTKPKLSGTMRGIDVSSWQDKPDFDLAEVNPDFVIIRTTYGMNSVDNFCDTVYQEAIRLDIPRGIYHFAHPELNSAADEAKNFLDRTKGYRGDARIFLDFEPPEKKTSHVAWIQEWCEIVEIETGVKVGIYTNFNWLEGLDWSQIAPGRSLWLADPSGLYESGRKLPECWESVAIWQYALDEKVPGKSYYLDYNLFYGDKGDWLDLQ
jgi:Lyzozyme M1 (1,4-beta-N-acetylmuramidase)